jgi:hypothetical protein
VETNNPDDIWNPVLPVINSADLPGFEACLPPLQIARWNTVYNCKTREWDSISGPELTVLDRHEMAPELYRWLKQDNDGHVFA